VIDTITDHRFSLCYPRRTVVADERSTTVLTRQTLEPGADGASTLTVDAAATRSRLATVAATIEQGGIDADPMSVLLVAHTARDLEISPVLVSVLADEKEPAVARERAFARISVLMDSRLDAIHRNGMLPVTC
jgi:hypothetical protein